MERRSTQRIETNVHLTCRVPAMPCRATMHDLTYDGCRIEVPQGKLEHGATMLIDLPGAAGFPGTVMWVKGTQAGIRFERRLGKASAIALGIEQPDPEPDPEPQWMRPEGETFLRHWVRRLLGLSVG